MTEPKLVSTEMVPVRVARSRPLMTRVVGLVTVKATTFLPPTLTLVALRKLLPVRVRFVVAAATPLLGVNDVIVGAVATTNSSAVGK